MRNVIYKLTRANDNVLLGYFSPDEFYEFIEGLEYNKTNQYYDKDWDCIVKEVTVDC